MTGYEILEQYLKGKEIKINTVIDYGEEPNYCTGLVSSILIRDNSRFDIIFNKHKPNTGDLFNVHLLCDIQIINNK